MTLEQKYILYFAYLNNKYNGILQENDIGRLGIVKKYLDEGLETLILNMTKPSFLANSVNSILFNNNLNVSTLVKNLSKLIPIFWVTLYLIFLFCKSFG